MAIFEWFVEAARRLNGGAEVDASGNEQNLKFLESEIMKWRVSKDRKEQLTGFMYYEGYHDILLNQRTAIGKSGELEVITNLPNRQDIDNQYAIAVDKKANYFLGRPISFMCENEVYAQELKDVFNSNVMRKLKNLSKKAMNGGVAWLYPSYDEKGNFKLTAFPAYEIKPYWKDQDNHELDFALRMYSVSEFVNNDYKYVEYVEVYALDGVYKYYLESNELKPAKDFYKPYLTIDGSPYAWEDIPLIPFKYNENSIPLIRRVKGLQDAINELMSMFHNNMLEDSRNTILVIENYDGQDLAEFRKNLNAYGAVKVRSGDGARGGVSTLQVEVNSTNYESILQLLKTALIENARSFDGKFLQSGTPNQMNILSMYQDIDIDTNDFESEFSDSLQKLLYFVNIHLSLNRKGDFFGEDVKIIFNRDMLMNESEIMNTLNQSGVKISNETLLSQVPFVDDVEEELKRIEKEQEKEMEMYADTFPTPTPSGDEE